jgi:hypothetical protein
MIQFWRCDWQWGPILYLKSCGQESPKRALQKHEIDVKSIGGQGIEKSFQMEVCLPVRRAHTGVVCVCKHTFQSPNSMKKYSNKPTGVIIAIFGMSAAATGIW